ncbi:phage tail tape measure protein [Streptomyces sp. NBC_01180]|uniref:phage tail tape measure protein n=1 Tax=Streptomyces sp. NBC_01180 TaxID=2903763 RepID=UPI003869E9BB|nr:phage tail tape measure protein [Streptomyces sp. NBC_01180]
MTLTVGELLATIDVDDSGAARGMRSAESAVRRGGDRIQGDAERAGQHAGQALGDGLADGAQAGGDAVGDNLARSGGEGADKAAEGITGRLSAGLMGGLAAVGTAVGAVLMSAMSDALEQGQITGRLAAQLGATPAEARKYGDIAGSMYADAVTEDFQSAADAISATMRAGIAPPEATNAQIKSMATKVSDLADTFDLDLGQTANAVGQMLKTGLAKNGTEALDALTAGLQKMGPRADDIADTFNEYSTIFRNMGLDATTATGLLSQGMKAGARDTDVVADSLKEFTLIVQGGGDKVDQAFASIGLNGKAMQKAFTEGGPKAKDALDKTFDALRGVGDQSKRQALAVALFGTKSEDMQKALFSLDPSNATDTLGKVGGAADQMGDSLRDNAGVQITAFKRGMQQHLVDFLGGTVIPALEGFKSYVSTRFSSIWTEAGKGGTEGVDRYVALFEILGQRVVEKIRELGPKAIQELMGAGQKIADFITANPGAVLKGAAIAVAIAAAIAQIPILTAGALISAASAITAGFTDKLISSLDENLPRWWGAFTDWLATKASATGSFMSGLGSAIGAWFGALWGKYVSGPVSRVWNSFIASVNALPGRAVGALGSLGSRLSGSASNGFQRFKDAAAAKASAFVSWVAGMPGRISSAVGGLGSLLYGKGQNVVTGLWHGIQSMGGWLRSTLMGWAKNLIPGPIAKALGIHSPSKVMADQIGRWIPAGIVKGIEGGAGAVARTMANLVPVPDVPPLAFAGYGSASDQAAGYGVSSGLGMTQAGATVHVEHWHAAENGTPDDNAKALDWLAKARG